MSECPPELKVFLDEEVVRARMYGCRQCGWTSGPTMEHVASARSAEFRRCPNCDIPTWVKPLSPEPGYPMVMDEEPVSER